MPGDPRPDHRRADTAPVGTALGDRAVHPGVRPAAPRPAGLRRPGVAARVAGPAAAVVADPASALVGAARPHPAAVALGGRAAGGAAGADDPPVRAHARLDRLRLGRDDPLDSGRVRRPVDRPRAGGALEGAVAAPGGVRTVPGLDLAPGRCRAVLPAHMAVAASVEGSGQAGSERAALGLAADREPGRAMAPQARLGTRPSGRTFGLQSARAGCKASLTPYS